MNAWNRGVANFFVAMLIQSALSRDFPAYARAQSDTPPLRFTTVGVTFSKETRGFELSLIGPYVGIPLIGAAAGWSAGYFVKNGVGRVYAEAEAILFSLAFVTIGGGPVFETSGKFVGTQTTVAVGATQLPTSVVNLFPFYRRDFENNSSEFGLMLKMIPFEVERSVADFIDERQVERKIASDRKSLAQSVDRSLAYVRVNHSSDFTVVRNSSDYMCGLSKAGKVSCWGSPYSGPVEHTVTGSGIEPTAIRYDQPFRDIQIAENRACGITKSDLVACWQPSERGSPGEATPLDGLTNVASLSLGPTHSCALRKDGAAFCWGEGNKGQLGNGSTSRQEIPQRVLLDKPISSLSVARFHSCAIAAKEAFCWGEGSEGHLGRSSDEYSAVPVHVDIEYPSHLFADSLNCAKVSSGELSCFGFKLPTSDGFQKGRQAIDFVPEPMRSNGTTIDVLIGANCACALQIDRPTCWGEVPCESSKPFHSAIFGMDVARVDAAHDQNVCVTAPDFSSYCLGKNGAFIFGDYVSTGAKVAGFKKDKTPRHRCAAGATGADCWPRDLPPWNEDDAYWLQVPVRVEKPIADSVLLVGDVILCAWHKGGVDCRGSGLYGERE